MSPSPPASHTGMENICAAISHRAPRHGNTPQVFCNNHLEMSASPYCSCCSRTWGSRVCLVGFFFIFKNSDTLLNSCSNLQDCGAACASTDNTAEDREKTRLLEFPVTGEGIFRVTYVTHMRGFIPTITTYPLCASTQKLCAYLHL